MLPPRIGSGWAGIETGRDAIHRNKIRVAAASQQQVRSSASLLRATQFPLQVAAALLPGCACLGGVPAEMLRFSIPEQCQLALAWLVKR
jgi:hypothetical protein